MTAPTQPRLRLYTLALQLYPSAFRSRYAAEMLQTARLEYAKSSHRPRFIAALASDTLRSLLREHLRAASAASPGYVAAFALFFSVLLLTVAVVDQQILRRGADRQPTFIAQLVSSPQPGQASEAAREQVVSGLLAAPKQEIASLSWLHSARPFVALYDASGNAIAANATLHGVLPQPPRGIFNVIQQRGEDKITWQPQPGIRVALTGRPMPNGGFVLSGQSLIPSESRTALFYRYLRWMWALALLTCACLALFARKPTRHPAS